MVTIYHRWFAFRCWYVLREIKKNCDRGIHVGRYLDENTTICNFCSVDLSAK